MICSTGEPSLRISTIQFCGVDRNIAVAAASELKYKALVNQGSTRAFMEIGDPDRIRTYDIQLRRLALYPTELRDP